MYFRKLFTFLLTIFVLTSLTTAIAFAQDPDKGKETWEKQVWQCMNCHGPAGEGKWGPPLAGSEKTAQEFITQVRTPRRNMPTFSEAQVSDEQIIDIHAYLTSLPKPTGFTPADAGLPADAPEAQQLIVEKRCVACHSPTGPVKNFVDQGKTPTAEAVIKQLRTPFKLMPSFSPDQVSDAEATTIAEFLASEFAAQAPPSTLPQSGQAAPSTLPLMLLLAGGGLLLTGFLVRRLTA
jgi:ubiquinol-cytochrome c reductase cytochrome c subunit